MTNRQSRPGLKQPHSSAWRLHGAMLIAFVASLLTCAFLWLLPVDVAQQWAFDRAGSGAFDRFEAVGTAAFSLWLLRVAATLLWILIWIVWSDLTGWLAYGFAIWLGLMAITESESREVPTSHKSLFRRVRTIGCRGFLMAWLVLFGVHAAQAIGLSIHDWPYFRFNSGEVVLPNISDSNRAVIHYLQEATPPDARILVASDQKLFFLSYYLRPRMLLHRMHPESEHVIPLKDQQRKLVAYRLDELTAGDLEQMPHDYTLEYFEHPDLVDQSQIMADAGWISFIRRREHNPSLVPSYVVRLRAVREQRR
jgi:hypothetical protein